ncbi:conserved exported protein of unknown function [Candidatus Filomicrobium marinum]|uniref:Uncharacterized protein n=1 Tax=Candidatus Filomicrobium marinum TaxID=1608628 RepID=A0A0D6JGN1_9HYPH|nr:hypothetical protein [Candidatus Filomicrobium marinum]CFX49710.1 conserved exported protein of unknown function [Candidatus Filomicrobium marinum]CPR20307.1 conserved exported protein of unknown function [Candidatus Filomicrobium marinum]
MRDANARFTSRPVAIGLGAFSALLATGLLFFSTSETMLKAQFVTAFDSYSAPSPTGTSKTGGLSLASLPFAAGEDFWLGSSSPGAGLSDHVRPASWSGSVAVGDEISLSGNSGRRVFEIVAITELPVEGLTRVLHGGSNDRMILVTAREKGSSKGQIIRFVIDRDDANVFGDKLASPHSL